MKRKRIKVAGQTPVFVQAKPGRNDLCPCGSGLKFKTCHGFHSSKYVSSIPNIEQFNANKKKLK